MHFMEASALLGKAPRSLPPAVARMQLWARSSVPVKRSKAADRHTDDAQQALSRLAHYLEDHGDASYERHLKSCGFKGSHFLLAEYKSHLDSFRQALGGVELVWPRAEEAVRGGVLDDFLKDFSPGAKAAMRIACLRVIEMLEFQHHAAETRYCYLSFDGARRWQLLVVGPSGARRRPGHTDRSDSAQPRYSPNDPAHERCSQA
jgi:hypothetical protein